MQKYSNKIQLNQKRRWNTGSACTSSTSAPGGISSLGSLLDFLATSSVPSLLQLQGLLNLCFFCFHPWWCLSYNHKVSSLQLIIMVFATNVWSHFLNSLSLFYQKVTFHACVSFLIVFAKKLSIISVCKRIFFSQAVKSSSDCHIIGNSHTGAHNKYLWFIRLEISWSWHFIQFPCV